MCEVCLTSPCNPRCPNAPEPPTVYTCEYCREPIVVGEDYWQLDGDYWHEDCFDDQLKVIVKERFDAYHGIAEVEEPC